MNDKGRAILAASLLLVALLVVAAAVRVQLVPWEGVAPITISESTIVDKLKGSWVGQMAGVTWGAPTEFLFQETVIPDAVVPSWTARRVNRGFGQDDIYVEIPFLDAMKDHGVNCGWDVLGEYFRDTEFDLWHANRASRDNLRRGIPAPDSGHYIHNLHSDDIDWQIEADFVGQMCPGQVNTAIEMAWRAGHVINYGDGVYGGVFVAAMHARAYTASSVDEIIEAGRQAVPQGSKYGQVIEDVISWERQGSTWEETWQLLQDKWGDDDRCPEGANSPFNIDAKLNGAYILIGLLYGDGDFERSMQISMQCGQDSDCNPSSVGGILGAYLGLSNIPDMWKSALDSTGRTFAYTNYTFNDAVNVNLGLAREVLRMNGGWISGSTWYIPRQGAVRPPILEQWPHPVNAKPNLNAWLEASEEHTVKLSASATDEDGVQAYQWFFGDLSSANGPSVSHTYRQGGTYDAVCYVTDNTGNTAWQIVRVTIGSD
jgi:ADP-ribosylglycohydrolase